jgi:hypothetical protein
VHLFAGFDAAVEGGVRLQLSYADGTVVTETVPLVPAGPVFAPELPRLAAAQRLKEVDPAQGLHLALVHRLVSRYTDTRMVAKRADGERAQELPELHVVPHMLAAGWGGRGQMVCCRQTVFDVADAQSEASLDLAAPMPALPAMEALCLGAAAPRSAGRPHIAPATLVDALDERCAASFGRDGVPTALSALRAASPGWGRRGTAQRSSLLVGERP